MYITRLLQPYFGHLSCIPFVCMTGKECLICMDQSVVEKLPSFDKLVFPFRKSIAKSAFLMRFAVSFCDIFFQVFYFFSV